MDLTLKVRITDWDQMYKAFDLTCASKALYNFVNYEVRKEYFEHNYVPTYSQLCDRFKNAKDSNGNIPYRRLPAAISQQVLKQLSGNWLSFFRATKEYYKNPSRFLGKPKPPKYINDCVNLIVMDHQRCIQSQVDEIKFTKNVLNPVRIPRMILGNKIKVIRIVPHHNQFDMEFVYEVDEPSVKSNGNTMAIDLGLDNFVTTANDAGDIPFIINGKIIKSINQNYNRKASHLQSRLPKKQHTSKLLTKLALKRKDQLRDQMHKISSCIIEICEDNDYNKLVVGWNPMMKQNANMGRINNQNFVQVPYYKFRNMLEYKCQLKGIEYVEIEESYTSKCSYFDSEPIQKHQTYEGKRITRGQFRTKNGDIVNADLNAAYNILHLETNKRFPNPHKHPVRFTVGSRETKMSMRS